MRVKCRADGELPTGRRDGQKPVSCGAYVRIPLHQKILSPVGVSGSAKEVFFMKKLLTLISESYHEFKKVNTITCCAMFGAMSIVLSYVASIRVTPNLKIGLGALPNEMVDYLFGPVVGALFGGGMDIIKFMMKPDGGFMPGFTFNAMLAAFIYGIFLYKKPISLTRMMIAKFIVAILCNIILGTYWLSMINGKGFIALLPGRIVKNLIQAPADAILFYVVAQALEKAKVFKMIKPDYKGNINK